MDSIYRSAQEYKNLLPISYRFDFATKRRKVTIIELDFLKEDFFHICGLQHLDDIEIPRNRRKTLEYIDDGVITDELLKKAKKYYDIPKQEDSDIESRIEEASRLKEYLETNNLIRIFSLKDAKASGKMIEADYVIKSRLPNSYISVFIFLRKRKENDRYCVISFFKKKNNEYTGEALYWMMKTKINNNGETVLFKHKNYNPDK